MHRLRRREPPTPREMKRELEIKTPGDRENQE
jgi:hypothetical protein